MITARPGQPLTKRELQVLAGVAHGRTIHEIGSKLYLSESTVRTYMRCARRKLGARNRAHAATIAFVRGLLNGERAAFPAFELPAAAHAVLAMYARGLENEEIAARIGCNRSSVTRIGKQIRDRLGATNRAHAVAIGYETGLLPKQERGAAG